MSLDQIKPLQSHVPNAGSHRRDWQPFAILFTLAVGFLALAGWVFGDRLRPRIPVETHPVLLIPGEEIDPTANSEAARPVAQASGWIEPDPFPIRISALIDGFIAEVFVLEGESVEAGDIVARFDDTNFALALARAEAEWQAARAEAIAAELALEQAVAEQRAAEARWKAARDRADRARALRTTDLAEAERIGAELLEEDAAAQAEAARLRVDAQRRMIERLRALEARAKADAERARIDLARTRVTAPINGVVLRRHVAPGMKRTVSSDDPDSSTIVTLYDATRLQVRADVPLSEIGRIHTGMEARVVSSAFPNRIFTGVVSRITAEADLSRNTLQVKVSLRDPDPRLRPDMLCRVEFVATEQSPGVVPQRLVSLWIPKAARVEGEGGETRVWVVDSTRGVALPREIRLSTEERADDRQQWIRVLDGLRPGERVVTRGAERLRPGARVFEQAGDMS